MLRLDEINQILIQGPYGAKSAGPFSSLDSLRDSIWIDLSRKKHMSKLVLVISQYRARLSKWVNAPSATSDAAQAID